MDIQVRKFIPGDHESAVVISNRAYPEYPETVERCSS